MSVAKSRSVLDISIRTNDMAMDTCANASMNKFKISITSG